MNATNDNTRPYPEGWDWRWLACDREGQVALFANAGRGPVPVPALDLDYPNDMELRIGALPTMSDARLMMSYPMRGQFMTLAERGVFAFDWSDTQRAAADAIDAYELIAMPYRPLTLDQLPEDLANAARSIRFTRIAFADSWRIDVRAHLRCREPAH